MGVQPTEAPRLRNSPKTEDVLLTRKRTVSEIDKLHPVDYLRRPFMIQAVEITIENIKEIARHIGEVRYKPDGITPYIRLDRRVVPRGTTAYLGFYVTFSNDGNNIRVYSRRGFNETFYKLSSLDPASDLVRAVQTEPTYS